MIPKIIHLTARNKNNLSKQFSQNLKIMKSFYTDFEFKIYDDVDIDDFVTSYDRSYYDNVFSKLPRQIMRVDTVRYMWMEAIGGIYFDFDILVQRPWRPDHGAVLVMREWTWPEAKDIQVSVHNCVFASEPQHPLWRCLLEGIADQVRVNSQKAQDWPSVFDVTGPNAISRTITQNSLDQKLQDVHILAPSHIYQEGLSKGSPEKAAFIHQTSGSWKEPSTIIQKIAKRLGI